MRKRAPLESRTKYVIRIFGQRVYATDHETGDMYVCGIVIRLPFGNYIKINWNEW
jgi:hypothetical protein